MGNAYYPECFERCGGAGSSAECPTCDFDNRVCEKITAYEDTGLTPQELKERDAAKAPALEGDGYDQDGNIVYDTWICPNCGERYEIDYDDYDFCPKCAQRILK